jgi:hypothetical protein
MASSNRPANPNGRNGNKLRIPLPFEDAIRAGLETPPAPPKPKKKRPAKKK